MPDREGLEGFQEKPEGDTARVFFALWPDDRLRQRLAATADRMHRLRGGRRTRTEKLHLTLVFLGDVPREGLPALQACAAAVQVPPFDVVFDREDCWRHNRIAFLTASEVPGELTMLVGALEEGLAQAGFRFDRRPYKPHITLVRHANCRKDAPPDTHGGKSPRQAPLVWPATDFVLVESRLGQSGSSYVPIGRYALL